MIDPFVAATCRALSALKPSEKVLLAVSGGADSMALLDALWSGRRRRDVGRLTFTVGHFDHRLRKDSGRDCLLVEAAARERELEFVWLESDGIQAHGAGPEEAARKERYRALVEMARQAGCGAIATAHTATDQAETLLWRLVRGAGRRGLSAMRPSRSLEGLQLLRPLLGTTREETRAYCERQEIVFHDDPTNLNERPRARLRAEVLPVLERLSPGAVRRLAEAAGRLGAEDTLLDRVAVRAVGAGWNAETLANLPEALRRRALLGWVEEQLGTRRRITSTHIRALESLVRKGTGEVELPSTASERRLAVVTKGSLSLSVRSGTIDRGRGRLKISND